ncbi:hypothetical protein [Pseudomonas phage LUZ7]|uniref:Uncharacterized protein n=1 Tax=Pseudomonas phage LUZ7 TaxID=655097 RepID=C8ZKF1_9CAUD|nr:hypothetical protein PP-LUZ7_gp031 [Pseudomonas phage LUZ7]CAZ66172.1 hypothetical protein [Pseudomonas phage LUZ7]
MARLPLVWEDEIKTLDLETLGLGKFDQPVANIVDIRADNKMLDVQFIHNFKLYTAVYSRESVATLKQGLRKFVEVTRGHLVNTRFVIGIIQTGPNYYLRLRVLDDHPIIQCSRRQGELLHMAYHREGINAYEAWKTKFGYPVKIPAGLNSGSNKVRTGYVYGIDSLIKKDAWGREYRVMHLQDIRGDHIGSFPSILLRKTYGQQ